MPPVDYDLWFFPESSEYGESLAATDLVALLPPETIFLKAANRLAQALGDGRCGFLTASSWRDACDARRPRARDPYAANGVVTNVLIDAPTTGVFDLTSRGVRGRGPSSCLLE